MPTLNDASTVRMAGRPETVNGLSLVKTPLSPAEREEWEIVRTPLTEVMSRWVKWLAS